MLNKTIKAVKAFQRDHGLYPSGTVNQALIDLMAETAKATPEPVLTVDPQTTPAP